MKFLFIFIKILFHLIDHSFSHIEIMPTFHLVVDVNPLLALAVFLILFDHRQRQGGGRENGHRNKA